MVVSDVLNAQELEDLKQDLAVMTECNGAVVRVTLLDLSLIHILTRWKRSISFCTRISNGVVMVPSSW